MSGNLNLALTLSLNDRLIGPLQRAFGDVKRTIGDGARELDNVVRSSGRAADALGKVGQKGREAGKAAADLRGIGAAAEDAEKRVGRLHAALGQLTGIAGKGASIFAGFKAAQAVLADPRERAQAYELSLAKLSNVLYTDRRTVSGRQAGQVELDSSIRRATQEGVTREDALGGLRVVGAAGGIDRKDAMSILPTLAKFSVAGEASMEDVAALAVKSMKGFNIKPDQLPKIMEMALVSGQMGNFEFKDMAKWLPQQMAMSKSMLGMSGIADFGQLLAINQMAVNTAGGSQEAGNNVVNFLGKINSADTQKDFQRAGIDLTGTLANARGTGVRPVDAFLNLLEGQFAKDKGYTALQDKLKSARASGDPTGEAQTLEAMRGIFAGSVMGKFIQDRQAQMGMVGVLNDRTGLARLQQEAAARSGESDLSQETLMATSAMKNTVADSAQQARQYDALKGVNEALADHRLKLADLSGRYPEAAKWLERVSLAAQAAAAGLAVFGLGNLLTKALPGATPGAALGAGAGGLAARAGILGLTGALAYGAGTLLNDHVIAGTKVGDGIGEMIANVMAFLGSDDAREALASQTALKNMEAAETMNRAAEKLSNLKIGVSSDTTLFTGQIMEEVVRQSTRE